MLVKNHWLLVTLLEKKYQLVIKNLTASGSSCNDMPVSDN